MLIISKPLSPQQLHAYYTEEYGNVGQNYYTRGADVPTRWHGQLAERWGLTGAVDPTRVYELALGHHPVTGEELVRTQAPRTYTNDQGKQVHSMPRRAGWDLTFSAPKTVSLTALVGKDERVRRIHEETVRFVLDELEKTTQARIRHTGPAETTGRWVAALFEHDSARPVNGYAAPQLHTHAVIFNLTETADGKFHALQPRELYRLQSFATALYRAETGRRYREELGYEIERGKSGQAEIKGYTQDYLEASSPRSKQIKEYLARTTQSRSAEARAIAAQKTRERKPDAAHRDMSPQHGALAAEFGDQPAQVVRGSHCRDQHLAKPLSAAEVVTYATERNLERDAVVDEHDLLRDALKRGLDAVAYTAITAEVDHRLAIGDLIAVAPRSGATGRAFTTPAMLALERELVDRMRQGQQACAPLVEGEARYEIDEAYPHLNDGQRTTVQQVLANRDWVQAIDGVAGGGKTTTLAAIHHATRRDHVVVGLAPTSGAAQQLAESGMSTMTVQRFLSQQRQAPRRNPKVRYLVVIDEASQGSTTQLHAVFQYLSPRDRVLLVGDSRQHQAVEAGRPFQQLQEAGMAVARLETIVRQREPGLKSVVEALAHGDVRHAVDQLDTQGRVHEIPGRIARLRTVAQAYVQHPEGTLVVSPDNPSREALNQLIHKQLQASGHVQREERRLRVLVPRQDLTGADRQWAEQYHVGDVLRFDRGSQKYDVKAGEYVRVAAVHAKTNQLTVIRQTGADLVYEPRRLYGVSVYRDVERAFAVGDRLQITAPDPKLRLANRELGTVERIESDGTLSLRLDRGGTVPLSTHEHAHLDYGYAVTSYSSQGQTADRVLVHIETEGHGAGLVNRRLAYVAISRGRYDAQIYTDDKEQLPIVLDRDVSKQAALARAFDPEAGTTRPSVQITPHDLQLTLG